MRCRRCGGLLLENWDREWECIACGSSPHAREEALAAPPPPPRAPYPRSRSALRQRFVVLLREKDYSTVELAEAIYGTRSARDCVKRMICSMRQDGWPVENVGGVGVRRARYRMGEEEVA